MYTRLLPLLIAFGILAAGAVPPLAAAPIHEAAKKGNIKQLTRLLKNKKANLINARDEQGMAPLHYAAQGNHDKAVALLLENGSEIDPKSANGDVTPLMMAVAKKAGAVVDLLLEHGADANAISEHAGGPLHMAARLGDMNIFEQLLRHGANPITQDKNEGWAPIHYAVFFQQRDIVRRLLADSVIVDAKAHRGYTPLHIAAERGDVETMELLLAHKADPNTPTMSRRTPLHEAARRGRLEAVQLLLDSGADPSLKDEYNATALEEATQYEHTEIVRVLRAHANVR